MMTVNVQGKTIPDVLHFLHYNASFHYTKLRYIWSIYKLAGAAAAATEILRGSEKYYTLYLFSTGGTTIINMKEFKIQHHTSITTNIIYDKSVWRVNFVCGSIGRNYWEFRYKKYLRQTSYFTGEKINVICIFCKSCIFKTISKS